MLSRFYNPTVAYHYSFGNIFFSIFLFFRYCSQDGTFSVSDFAEAFQEHEVQRVLRAYPDTVTMDIHCDSSAGLWSALPDKNYAKTCKIRINPVDVLDSGSDRIKAFVGECDSLTLS